MSRLVYAVRGTANLMSSAQPGGQRFVIPKVGGFLQSFSL
jgi:hypothetical protein